MTPLRILVVEDDGMIGVLLAELMEALGHRVCGIATTEADAVAAALRHKPDLMIVDARLGQGSGVAAVETILGHLWIPHVFISGAQVHVLRPGSIVLQKPFLEADLVRAIARAMLPAATRNSGNRGAPGPSAPGLPAPGAPESRVP